MEVNVNVNVNRRGKSYRTALALIDAGVAFRSPRTAKNSLGKNSVYKRTSDVGVSQSALPSGVEERSDSLHPTKQAVLNRLRESLKQLNSKGMFRTANTEQDSSAKPKLQLQSVEIPVGANNGLSTLASVNRSENNLVSDTVTSASVTSTNERVSQTIMPSTSNAVHNSGNATSVQEQNNQTVAADTSTPLASNNIELANENAQDKSENGTLAGAKVEGRATEVTNLTSGSVGKLDSKTNTDTTRPEQEPRPLGTLAATPRTLKSLSNIKAASTQPTSLSLSRFAGTSNKPSTLRNAKSAEVEERRKKLIIEARRKLQEIAQLEKRESDQPADERNQPSPTTSHRSVASAKSESYLRKLQRTDVQNDNYNYNNNNVPLVARKIQARPPASSPVSNKQNGTSKTDETHAQPVRATGRRADGDELGVNSVTLPRNFHMSNEEKRDREDKSTAQLAVPVATQNNTSAAKSQNDADERRSSPETVISVGAYSRKVSATRSVANQNAVSVANLISELQPRSGVEPRQMSLSTSSYTLALEASTTNLSGSKSTISIAPSEAARRAARRPVVKRNVCIQCNLMRNQAQPQTQPQLLAEPRKATRRNPPLSKILQHYELVTFSVPYSPDTTSPIDFGIRLFESLFVDDLHGPLDDTPWSINGKRPVLAADTSAFKKVVRPQTDKGTAAAQQPNESLLAIDSIRENSAAHRDGRLCVGDYVVEVNGVLLLTHESAETAEKLINAVPNLVLVVARSLQQSADEQKNDKLINKGTLSRALQSELAMLKSKYDRLKSEMKRNEVLISEMRNAVARKAKIRQVLKAQAADLAAKPLTQNAFKTIHLEEQLVHVV